MNNYRNYITTIFILLFFGIKATSQIGFRAGISITDIIIDPEVQSQYLGYEVSTLDRAVPLPGFQIGFLGNIKIAKKLDFQPELLYVKLGTQLKSDYIYDDVGYKLSINYLQLPLLLNYGFLPEKSWHPRVFAGPYVSYKLKAKKSIEINGEETKIDFSQVKNYDFGLIFGFSFDFEMNKGQVILDMRIDYGLINSIEKLDNYTPHYGDPDTEMARNMGITLSAGYRWGTIF